MTVPRHSEKLPLEVLDAAGGDARVWHDFFVNLRDKYIAHSVNSLDQAQVVATLTNKAGVEHQVLSVQTTQLQTNPVDAHSVDGLRWVVSIFNQYAVVRFAALLALVREEVNHMELADVYKLDPLRFVFPDIYELKDIRRTRKKLRRPKTT
jgi:hypothetical protein